MTEVLRTVLYDRHAKMAAKTQIVPFAGWMMPVWYDSIKNEHNAVRKTAGLFDCSHMAVLKIAGKDAAEFLNIAATNDTAMLCEKKAQYAYLLDENGKILDDIIIYCIADDDFMVVANASNEQKVKDWLGSLSFPDLKYTITDLKNSNGDEAKVDIALQGPACRKFVKDIFGIDVSEMKALRFDFAEFQASKIIIAKTGYTGSKDGVEFFVNPKLAEAFWDMVLEKGKNYGITACGLGARDSLRIQAGLPLYGHELAGEFNLSPFQAGYGWAVKLNKENFIGKDAAEKQAENYSTEVARLKFDGKKGIRPVRQGDAVEADGRCIGTVLSCAAAENVQFVLAVIEKKYNSPDTKVGLYYAARNKNHAAAGRKEKIKLTEKITADIQGTVAERFEKF